MPGDFSRNSDNANNRFSALFMQQGRVQLDADWNESVEILRRRIRVETKDFLGPAAVPHATTPNGFQITFAGTDLAIGPGRIYVDGILAECFATDNATYSSQPFLHAQPALSTFTGNVLVYLDVWEREITTVENPAITDKALNGVDTGTRLQTVWQVKVTSQASACTSDFSQLFPQSGGQLTTGTTPVTQAPDPCSLPGSGGYQGVDNRLYRVEVHDPVNLLFKWSRDNGSVATTVSSLSTTGTAASGSTTLTVASLGKDNDLSFKVTNWVEVTDDLHELAVVRQPGAMAQITAIDVAARTITLDRNLAAAGFDPQGGNSLRVRRWDQSQGLTGTTGLVTATANTQITLENGIYVILNVPTGNLQVGDAWIFAARATDGTIDILNNAPPIAIQHHYCSLATIIGTTKGVPVITDCRVLSGCGGCDCTECVSADDHNSGRYTIQEAISRLTLRGGGTLCLGSGTFNIKTGITIAKQSFGGEFPQPVGGNIEIRGTGNATVLSSTVPTAIIITGVDSVSISDLSISCPAPSGGPLASSPLLIGIYVNNSYDLRFERCLIQTNSNTGEGVGIDLVGYVGPILIRDCTIYADYAIASFALTDSLPSSPASDSAYFSPIQLSIEDNTLTGGVVFYGQSVAYDAVTIARNVLYSSAHAAIALYGTSPTGPVLISGNNISVSGNATVAIDISCDDTQVFDNVVSLGTNAAQGIYVHEPPPGGQIRCDIQRNRISGATFWTGMAGIYFNSAASRVTIRYNTIQLVDQGIVSGPIANADDLVIEGNEFLNIGTSATLPALPGIASVFGFVGIMALPGARTVIRANTFTNVGSLATAASVVNRLNLIVGVLVTGNASGVPSAIVVSDNELRNVGPTAATPPVSPPTSPPSTLPLTYGIAIGASFDRASVTRNRINFPPAARPYGYYGILVGSQGQGQADAEVSDNAIDAVPSSQPLLSVQVGGACILRANSVALLASTSLNIPSLPSGVTSEVGINASANTLIASDNQVNVFSVSSPPMGSLGMQLTAATRGIILGNISTSGIAYNNSTLQSPWVQFNVVS